VVGITSKSVGSGNEHERSASGSGFKHLTPADEAFRILLSNLPKRSPEIETVPISMALNRIIAKDVYSPIDVPRFDRAAMDGFAVIAEDTYGASTVAPVTLRSAGSIRIGSTPEISVKKGEAISIVTGGQMPDDANAVVMVEHTTRQRDGAIEISSEVHPGENVSRIGEDVRKGALVLKKGTRILPQDLGMLTYLGLNEVSAVRRLRIAVLSTGSELGDRVDSASGRIPDVNRPILIGAIRELGCEPVDLGIVADEFDQISARLKQGIQTADIVLVTAGTSVGPEDFVPRVINTLGKPGMLVHGVAMRPSMPTGLGVVDGKPIISLPGYPVSAYIAFLEFVYPLASHLLQTDRMPRPTIKVKLNRRVAGILGSRTYVRVIVSASGDGFAAEPVRTSGAGILSSLVQANGFIIIPEHTEGYEEGQLVEAELFRPWERGQTGK
jgi:molybdopterin molybdotransferase